MTVFVGLLRAVNVGGTGKLAMTDLAAICQAAGFTAVRTYIASGNVVFSSNATEHAVKAALEAGLRAHTGAEITVLVRSAAEMAAIVAANPFAAEPGNRVTVLFLNAPPAPDTLDRVTGRTSEVLRAGTRELYVHYPTGIVVSKLRIPLASTGTARNMNTVAALAHLANP